MTYTTNTYLAGLRPRLTNRDLAIMGEIGRFKLMTGNQILRLFFQEPERSELSRSRRCQSVLRRLTNHGLIMPVGERDPNKSYIYCLDIAGQRITQQTSNRPRRKYAWHSPLIPHTLAIPELWIRLVEEARAGRVLLHAYETEPNCWKRFGDYRLEPDAYVELDEIEGGKRYRSNWYIEIDRGHQHGKKISSKFPAYNNYWSYLEGQGRKSKGCLILVRNETRKRYLIARVRQQPERWRPMYTVALFDDALDVLRG